MEQHYSNLVQKYLANNLTASEQMELAVLSRLSEPHQVQGEMIVIKGVAEQEEVEEVPVQADGENDPGEDHVPEVQGQQQGETILIHQQQIEKDNFYNNEEEEDEDDDFDDDEEENSSLQRSRPDHEFSYLSLAYGAPPARNQKVFEELDSYISNWSSKRTPLPLSSGNGQVFEQLESHISTRNDRSVEPSPRSRQQLESRIAGWNDKSAPGWKDRSLHSWKDRLISGKLLSRRKVLFIAAGAALLILCISYLWHSRYKAQQRAEELHNRQLIPPGSNKATLILSDGSAIELTNRRDGLLTIQGGIEVFKSGDFMLEYKVPATGVQEVVSNTIATPRGGIYQLSLPDGSHITLNAGSSLTFPTVFSGPAREVVLTGEAFFEVAEDTLRPFRVKAGETVAEAIGTSFNILSYADEPQQTTTMVSGSVKLNALGLAYIIRPGEQAIVHYSPRRVQVRNAKVEEEVAWKNGKFRFFNRSAGSVVNQAARWYNMDVEWKGDFSGVLLSADTLRDVPLSGLLEMLEASGQVHFKTKEKRLIVFPGRW
ncbi:FecR family protein [Chitinophaga niabensis]|uniref:Uncharacterized protein n=1 Tax=Chitinophaga niabensis TaxID=536979 RepID=A0A1N6DF88_9BACT|nr:FecR domain-containing protein [Chitinophaga niabensis]SIN69471.1 protein of unknown function [Chitinophaga niabensis]